MGGGGTIGGRPGGSISSNLDFVGDPRTAGEVVEREGGFIRPLLAEALGVAGNREKDGDLV